MHLSPAVSTGFGTGPAARLPVHRVPASGLLVLCSVALLAAAGRVPAQNTVTPAGEPTTALGSGRADATASASADADAAAAAAAAIAKYRDFTPPEIAALPEAVRLDEVPIRYILAAQGYEDPEGFELVHSLKLQALMYDATRSFDDAVRAFQRDLGEPATGVLTVHQVAELTYRNGLVKLGRVELLNAVKAWSLRDDAAVAQGTWSAIDGRSLMPINEVRITCDHERMVCEERATYVVVPGRDAWNMAFLVLNSNDVYTVSRWRRQSLEASRIAGCREITLAIARDGEVVRAPGDLIPEDECVLPLGMQPEAPADLLQTVTLADGSDIIRAEYQQLQQRAFGYLNPEFRARLERWREAGAESEAPR